MVAEYDVDRVRPVKVNIARIGDILITLGQKAMSQSVPVVIASDQPALPTSISGTPTVTVAGVVAENIVQWGGGATALGQQISNASVPVVIASDQTAIPINQLRTMRYFQGTLTLSSTSQANTPNIDLTQASSTTMLDIRGFLLTLYNGTSQAITAADFRFTAPTLAGIATPSVNARAVGVNVPASYPGYIQTYFIPLMPAPAFTGGVVDVKTAAATSGSIGYVLALVGPGVGPIPGATPPATTTLTTTTDTAVVAAPPTDNRIYVRSVALANTSATATRVDLKENSGGTIRASLQVPANDSRVWNLDSPWPLPYGVGLYAALGTAVTDVRVNVEYLEAP